MCPSGALRAALIVCRDCSKLDQAVARPNNGTRAELKLSLLDIHAFDRLFIFIWVLLGRLREHTS